MVDKQVNAQLVSIIQLQYMFCETFYIQRKAQKNTKHFTDSVLKISSSLNLFSSLIEYKIPFNVYLFQTSSIGMFNLTTLIYP